MQQVCVAASSKQQVSTDSVQRVFRESVKSKECVDAWSVESRREFIIWALDFFLKIELLYWCPYGVLAPSIYIPLRCSSAGESPGSAIFILVLYLLSRRPCSPSPLQACWGKSIRTGLDCIIHANRTVSLTQNRGLYRVTTLTSTSVFFSKKCMSILWQRPRGAGIRRLKGRAKKQSCPN